MKKITKLLLVAMIANAIIACTKTNTPRGAASVTVVNAMAGNTSMAITFDPIDTLVPAATQINYNASQQLSYYSGQQKCFLHEVDQTTSFPNPKPLLVLSLDLPISSTRSLFLTGTEAHPDTLFVDDKPFYFPVQDTSMGIRFVNLSPGSTPISVNIEGQSNGSTINSLSYKGITNFKSYPANAAVSNYVFEFRDAATGDLLATYSINEVNNPGMDASPNLWRFRNFTLVFNGLPDNNPDVPQGVFVVNHY